MANLVVPVTPRIQGQFLEPSPRTGRSADSGYASLDASPTSPPLKTRVNRESSSLSARLERVTLNSYDGNSSEESSSTESSHGDSETESVASPSMDREKYATLPRVSRRIISRTDSYPTLLGRNSTHQRHGSDDTGLSSSRVSSLRALDRFVPMRDHATPGSEKLHTTKPLADLTPSERLVRHNQDAPDPFCFRRRALPPSPTEARRARRSSNSGTVLDVHSNNQPDRRVSPLSGHMPLPNFLRESKDQHRSSCVPRQLQGCLSDRGCRYQATVSGLWEA